MKKITLGTLGKEVSGIDRPETALEAISIYSDSGILDLVNRALDIAQRAIIKAGDKAKKTDAEIVTLCNAYRPEVSGGNVNADLESAKELALDSLLSNPKLKKSFADANSLPEKTNKEKQIKVEAFLALIPKSPETGV